MRMRGARGAVLRGVLLAALAALATVATARTAAEYVAADGFGAPERVVQLPSQTAAALAVEGGTPVVFWYDPVGVYRRALTDDPDERQVFEGRGLRGVGATSVGGDPAVLRIVRDFQTGRNAHVLAWRGDERTVAEALEVLPIALTETPAGPAWLTRSRVAGRGVLTLEGWNGSSITVRETDESLSGYDVVVGDDGVTWVGWLEGTTEQSAFGVLSNWSAFVARIDADGAVGPTFELGKALRRSDIDRVRLGVSPFESVQAMWPREDGHLIATLLQTASGDVARAEATRSDVELGPGIALAMAGGSAFWADDDRVYEHTLEPDARGRAVLWAPHAIQAGDVLAMPSGGVFLAWYGGGPGGSSVVYAAGTAEPFEPTWLDRVAASMGWNPWNVWSEALGQSLASLLVAVLVTMALSPLLWVSASLAVRFGTVHDGTWIGIGIGAAVVLLGVGSMRLSLALPAELVDALFGVWWHMMLALGLAVGTTWLLRRNRDTEPLLGTLLAAASCTCVATVVLAFGTYQAWAETWTGFL